MGEPSVYCYANSRKRKGLKALSCFSDGAGGLIVRNGRWRGGPAAFYGLQEATIPLFNRARASGKPWLYLDHGFFQRGIFYRCAMNKVQEDDAYIVGPNWNRLGALGVEFAPWRRDGSHIVICPHSEHFHRWVLGERRDKWISRVCSRLGELTDRPIVVRDKPNVSKGFTIERIRESRALFRAAIQGAWAVVVEQSNAAVEALECGVPVFVLGQSPARAQGLTDLARIETPLLRDDRAEWAARLAALQWTRDEMANGSCWAALRDIYPGRF